MTKKDYQVIASIIALTHLAYTVGADPLNRGTKASIDHYLAKTNPRYNREKFWAAVEKEVEEGEKLF